MELDSEIHILHAGGDPTPTGMLGEHLERQCHFRVYSVDDGEALLNTLRERQFHVVLVRFGLPGLNGLKLMKFLRSGEIDLPVIILDSEENERVAASVLQAGASHYLACNASEEFARQVCSAVHDAVAERQRYLRQKQLFTKRKLAELVFDVTREGIVVTDADNHIEAVNPAFTEITGYSFEEVAGKNPRILNSGRQDCEFFRQMWRAINEHGHWEGEIWNRKKSGVVYPEWLSINTLCEAGRVIQHIAVFSDITKRKSDQERIWHQANYDALTDLPNRTLLVDRAGAALNRAKRERSSMAIIFIDLDRFKYINDHYGHAAGDALLIEVASRISSTLRKSDTVVRISGDEFVVLMPVVQQAADAGRVAEKIISAISQPYMVSGNKNYISASAGIAVYPGDGETVETLMNHADVAMYKAKDAGRNQCMYFDQQMNDEAERRARIEIELLTALHENQLFMHYQPVFDLRNNRITHAESLVRWQHPEHGVVPPNDFVPVAETCGLIIPLGEWVANEVCRQLAEWRQRHATSLQLLLNVSPIQLMHANLDSHLHQAMQQYGLEDGCLGIEITENVLIDGAEKIKLLLDGMKANGMHFLLDDFGTGFSSMRYLRKLPLDGLKIDRGFVSFVDQDHEKGVLVRAMISMAHSLNLTVVAEGVERPEELEFLRANDCDYAQGYLLGRPMTAENLLEMMRATR